MRVLILLLGAGFLVFRDQVGRLLAAMPLSEAEPHQLRIASVCLGLLAILWAVLSLIGHLP